MNTPQSSSSSSSSLLSPRYSGRGRHNNTTTSNNPSSHVTGRGPRHGIGDTTTTSTTTTTTTSNTLPASGIPYGHVPAYLPGSASLVEQLDQRLLVVLRDGRHLIGILRSFDQFTNMIFEDTLERRIFICKKTTMNTTINTTTTTTTPYKKNITTTVCYYTDIQLGLYLIRGDSIVLMGEVDPDTDDGQEEEEEEDTMIPLSLEDFETLQDQKNLNEKQECTDNKTKEEQDMIVTNLTWDFDTDLVV